MAAPSVVASTSADLLEDAVSAASVVSSPISDTDSDSVSEKFVRVSCDRGHHPYRNVRGGSAESVSYTHLTLPTNREV